MLKKVFLQTNDQTPFVIGMDATWYQLFFPDTVCQKSERAEGNRKAEREDEKKYKKTDSHICKKFEYEGDYAENSFYFYNIDETVGSVVYALRQVRYHSFLLLISTL